MMKKIRLILEMFFKVLISEYVIPFFKNMEVKYLSYKIIFYLIVNRFLLPINSFMTEVPIIQKPVH